MLELKLIPAFVSLNSRCTHLIVTFQLTGSHIENLLQFQISFQGSDLRSGIISSIRIISIRRIFTACQRSIKFSFCHITGIGSFKQGIFCTLITIHTYLVLGRPQDTCLTVWRGTIHTSTGCQFTAHTTDNRHIAFSDLLHQDIFLTCTQSKHATRPNRINSYFVFHLLVILPHLSLGNSSWVK